MRMVALELHWPPDTLGGLYFDRIDYEGLLFWTDEIEAQIKEMTKKK